MLKDNSLITLLMFSITFASATAFDVPDILPDGAFALIAVSDAGTLAEEIYNWPLAAESLGSPDGLDDMFGGKDVELTFEEFLEVFDGEVALAVYDGSKFGRTGEVDEYGDVYPVVRMVLSAEIPPARPDYDTLMDDVFNALEDSAYEERDGEWYHKRKVDIKNKTAHGFKYAAVKITEEYETRSAPDEVYNSKEVKDIYIGDNGNWFVISDEERIFENIEKTARGGRLSDDDYYSVCVNTLGGPVDLITYVNLDRLAAAAPEIAAELRPSEYDEVAGRFLKEIAGDIRAFIFATSYDDVGPSEEAFAYIPVFSQSDYASLFGEPTEFKGPDAAPTGYGAYVFYSSGGFAKMLNSDSFRSIGEVNDEFGEEFTSLVRLLDTDAPDLLQSLGGEFVFCYREGAESAAGGQEAYFPDRLNEHYLFLTQLEDADRLEIGLRQLDGANEDIALVEYEGPAGARIFKYEFENEGFTLAIYNGWVYSSAEETEVDRALKESVVGNVLSTDAGFGKNITHLSPEQSTLIHIDYTALIGSTGDTDTPGAILGTMLGSATSAFKPVENGVKYEAYPYVVYQSLYSSFMEGFSSASPDY